MARERDEQGRITETLTPELVLKTVENGDHVVTAREVADELDYSRDGCRRKLNQLHDDGHIRKKKVGGRAVVYWVEDDDEQDD